MDLDALLTELDRAAQTTHPSVVDRPRLAALAHLPARAPEVCPLPRDLPLSLAGRLTNLGIMSLWSHQLAAREAVAAGRHVVVATGTASGKSLCYQLPLAERLLADPEATVLYLAPTKALAADQLRALRAFRLPQIRAATYDGDTPQREREAIRRTANVILTNPDMLHVGILPSHRRWGDWLANLSLVIVDELHVARGIFGAHVAAILRRLRRTTERYRADPTFVLTSATIANPAEHAANLTGLPIHAIERDGSPRPRVTVALWEPPLEDVEVGVRRSTLAEASDVLAGLVRADVATLAFVRSRKGAELLAAGARRRLVEVGMEDRVLAYRAGLLTEERRTVEQGLIDGTLLGVAATEALELGVDVGNLDAVVIAGWPGTSASFWQQAGRAGRRERDAAAVFIAGDDPLDRWFVANPSELWGRPLEAATADVTNPYVLGPHLRCAAWELALTADETVFAPAEIEPLLVAAASDGHLRERGGRWNSTERRSPAGSVGIRSIGGSPVRIVDESTGALIGDVDAARAHRTVHTGAVYLHQGRQWRIRKLDLEEGVALATADSGDRYTLPRSDTDVQVLETLEHTPWGRCGLHRGRVEVTTQVLAYEEREAFSERSLGLTELSLPPVVLVTQALWLTLPEAVLTEADVGPAVVPGAAHAAEHAAIGLLPLFAMCDRWDIGGVSTARHPDTGEPTIVIYDGHPGGVGITERGFATDDGLWRATLSTVASCPCTDGCPSCVQSPKCGNGNEPLDKAAAIRLISAALSERGAGNRRV